MQHYRIFLSSPVDVKIERNRADLVIRKINAERTDLPLLELIRWEDSHYSATSTYQDQIPRPSECQLVVCIFWKRVGTELPDTYRRFDGTTPTGSEYEFEEALKAAAARPDKLPDVYVYRKTAEVKFSFATLEFERAQYDRFMAFWQRWFYNEKGHFLAGFHTFETADEFEVLFETGLRKWLSARETQIIWTEGSPYRGLEPFNTAHAPIFFGRKREIERARARLLAAAIDAKPFLLVDGASGSGKSSLVRAGVIPRLGEAGGLSTVASDLRFAIVIPGQIAESWSAALAAELFGKHALGEELRLGDFNEPAALAGQLARADRIAAAPLVRALERVGSARAATEHRSEAAQAVLLIVVDQLEELFAWPGDTAADFLGFLKVLFELPHSPVWLVATMRSDFQHRVAEFPILEALAGRLEIRGPGEAERVLHLALPSPADLREMISNPARAAGLSFEISRDRDLLQLLEAEARPELMPAVQFLLNELYGLRKDKLLTLAAFDALGGVEGVMARRGEEVLEGVDQAAREAFPRIVRALVTQVRSDVPASARRIDERALAHDSAAMRLINALRDARLVTSDRAELRFAHESLFNGWGKLKDQIAQEQRLFKARERLEQLCDEWTHAPPAERPSRLLDKGLLADGRELLSEWGARALSDKQPQLPAFIAASEFRQKWLRRRWQIVAWAAALVCFVAGGVFYFQWQATEKAKEEMQAAYLVDQSRTSLNAGKIALAVDRAYSAFKLSQSEATRSALLSAVMEISPHLAAVMELGTDNGEAIAWTAPDMLAIWTAPDTLGIATRSPQVRAYKVSEGRARPEASSWALPAITRPTDGNPSLVHTLWPISTDELLAIYNEGSIAVLQRGATEPRLQPPASEFSIDSRSHTVAVGSSGSVIAMATSDDRIALFSQCDWKKQAAPFCQPEAGAEIRGQFVAISPDEKRIAVADSEGKIRIYDLAGMLVGESISAATRDPITALGFAENRNWLAVGTSKGEVIVFDLALNQQLVSERFSDRPIISIAWSPTDLHLAFGCSDSAICLWRFGDGASGKPGPVVRLVGHTAAIWNLRFTRTGNHLASTATDKTARVWSITQNMDAGFALIASENAEITALAPSVDRALVGGGSIHGGIHIWDVRRAAQLQAVYSGSEVHSLAFSRDGKLAAIHENDELTIIGTDPNLPPVKIALKADSTRDSVTRLAWVDSNRTVAVAFRNGAIALFDTTQPPDGKTVTFKTDDAKEPPSGIAATPDGRTLVVSYKTGKVRVWDIASRTALGTMAEDIARPGHKIDASLSVSPDGLRVAVAGVDATVTVYDIAQRKLWKALPIDAKKTVAAAFSGDGRRLAVLGDGNQLYVWDLTGGSPERYITVSAVPTKSQLGNSAQVGLATWLDWVSNDRIAVATGRAGVNIIELDPAGWRRRIETLGLSDTNTVKQ